MENLPKDLKKYLSEYLNSEELVKLCSVNKEMRKICSDKTYNDIWIHRIKNDFDLDYKGTDAYKEYMRLVINYNTQYWSVVRLDDHQRIDGVRLFDSKDKAIKYIYEAIEYEGEIEEIEETIFEEEEPFQFFDAFYWIEPTKLTKLTKLKKI